MNICHGNGDRESGNGLRSTHVPAIAIAAGRGCDQSGGIPLSRGRKRAISGLKSLPPEEFHDELPWDPLLREITDAKELVGMENLGGKSMPGNPANGAGMPLAGCRLGRLYGMKIEEESSLSLDMLLMDRSGRPVGIGF